MQFERFAASSGHLQRLASRAIAGFAVVGFALAAMPASAATLDRIKETGTIKLGYLTDARPFSFRNESGAAEGYAVALCQQVADQAKKELALPSLTVEWVPVTLENRLREVQQGGIDLLCTPTSVTLARRQDVAFSIPVFAGGNRAVVRADAPAALRDALADITEYSRRMARFTRGQGPEGNVPCRRRRDDVREMARGPARGVAGGRSHRAGTRLSIGIAAAP